MKKGGFTILFMLLITVVFITALTALHELTKSRIERNREIERIRSVMYACKVFPSGFDEATLLPGSATAEIPWDERQLLDLYSTHMKTVSIPIISESAAALAMTDSVDVLRQLENGKVVAYGFQIRGKGLWGTITAYVVVSTNLKRLVGVDFTDQVETPGLGARITEHEFKFFFRNLNLDLFHSGNTGPFITMVAKKNQSNIAMSTNSIQAITGATQTCQGVLKMMNNELSVVLASLKVWQGDHL